MTKTSIREIFSKSFPLRVAKKQDKRFHKFLGPFNMLTVEGCSDTALFSE